jgi:Rha family phage regulatory protein
MNDRVSEELLAAAAARHAIDAITQVSVPPLNFQDFIAQSGESLITDSMKIAMVFGRQHKTVLRSIDILRSQLPADHRHYFVPMVFATEIGSGATRNDRGFEITRDGFALLAMGFTGRRALAFKLAYIDAFNAMAAFIKNQRDGLRFRCMELELEDKDSKRRGSHHAKDLNQRKREKRVIDPELNELREKVQPKLV